MLFGNDLMSIIYMIPILLFSVAIHECSHAVTAYKLGDRSQKLQGRMTLDPFVHMDILGFISIVLVGFGWGKPVYVDDSNFKNKSKDNMIVSLAGPISNLLLAIILTVILKIAIIISPNILDLISKTTIGSIISKMFLLSIQFNVIFAVFNMLPFPPFDGSKVLLHFLPYKAKNIIYNLEKYSFYIIMFLFITGAYEYMINPFVDGITYLLNWFLNL
jgi:Zn-dependent protease